MSVLPRSRSRIEREDQPLVVALVEADRRLVEDVEHADEPGADLRREADALRLAAGERRRRAVHGEVVEPDVDEEPEPLADLLEDALADVALAIVQLELVDERERVPHRHR